MNILLHGATDFGSSNYGDFLYAYIVYNYFKEKYPTDRVDFYKPSDYYKKYLELSNIKNIVWNKYDYAVYIPGGYFGESHNANLLANMIHFYRFMIFGLMASFQRKKIIVLAIGAGPIRSILLKKPITKILSNTLFVTVRDHDSFMALTNLETKSRIIESADLILTRAYNFNIGDNYLINKIKKCDKKILLVHYNHSKEALNKFAEAVNLFNKNNDFQIVVTSDCCLDDDEAFYKEFSEIVEFNTWFHKYNSPFELTELLKNVDLVLTCKLHLGVVSCMFKKSVVVAAVHPGKTKRFYRDLGEQGRCVSLFDSSSNDISSMLNKYKNKCVSIPADMLNKADITWRLLDEYFEK